PSPTRSSSGHSEWQPVPAKLMARIDALLAHAARGRLVREGALVAIVGAPNVGKSSLFNALLNANRAIVTAVPGTTRDLLTERAEIGGLSLALVDTAGVHDTVDVVEREGVTRARQTLEVADLVIVVLDRSRALDDDDRSLLAETSDSTRLVVANKCDLAAAWSREPFDSAEGAPGVGTRDPLIEISVRTGAGLDAVVAAIPRRLNAGEPLRDRPAVTNVRHAVLLEQAGRALARATAALDKGISEEFPLVDLQEAANALQEIRGRRTSEDLLRHIFEKFCIGK
ncbi:MAG: GTP-binding protein, partial [Vicinamibacterales bacterium]